MTKIAMPSSASMPACVDWNACAVPENAVLIDDGRVLAAIFDTSSVACPSATPGRRLNESVTDGSWPEWFTLSAPAVCVMVATALNGTSAPDFDRTCRSGSADRSSWYFGNSSITTQYSLFGV